MEVFESTSGQTVSNLQCTNQLTLEVFHAHTAHLNPRKTDFCEGFQSPIQVALVSSHVITAKFLGKRGPAHPARPGADMCLAAKKNNTLGKLASLRKYD